MEAPKVSQEVIGDAVYIEKKRKELEIFFQDAKLPKEVIDRAIENELRPLKAEPRPYISASGPGEVKSEYEVMTGQPFTNVGEHSKPLTMDEVKEMLKDNPIIAEKARQIQIMTHSEGRCKNVAVPLDEIHLKEFKDMRDEIASADGDAEKINKINYENMQSLMNCVTDYKAKCAQPLPKAKEGEKRESSSSEDEEFEAIEKEVRKYTNKSYETRYKETQDMLLKFADRYEDTEVGKASKVKDSVLEIQKDPILKGSSVQVIRPERRKSTIEEVKETFAINDAINNPLTPDTVARGKKKEVEKKGGNDDNIVHNMDEILPKTFEIRLQDTEQALKEINSVLNTFPGSVNDTADKNKQKCESENIKKEAESLSIKFDEKMEQTLHTALETIFDETDGEKQENRDMEFKEMKNLARNIVEGADNLSTLIREDITNKLNSMNELLNDVNTALENSRKSNLAYQKLKEEGDILNKDRATDDTEENKDTGAITKITNDDETKTIETNEVKPVGDLDDIHAAISQLNAEIKCHEERINKSKERYEMRNKECNQFIKEVDEIMHRSHEILHPTKTLPKVDDLPATKIEKKVEEKEPAPITSTLNQEGEKRRKELWDIDLDSFKETMTNKKVEDYKKQERDRSKRIDNLLYDIKDKMKDNKEVLRLANNLLRREEAKQKSLDNKNNIAEITSTEDTRAQGDYVRVTEDAKHKELESQIPLITSVPPTEGDINEREEVEKKKQEAEKERLRQREFQIKLEREMEEMNRTPKMTKEFIKNHCRQHKLYCTPHLNDILYLHFKGFSKIENLEEYTGLKCIFLENNGIQKMEGLDTLSELKCLYLHYNVLKKIEGMEGCPQLDTLNLDHNFISKIENLSQVPDLHTLSIAHNMLSSVDDLEQLKYAMNLSVLDLSYNRLDDPLIVDVLADMNLLKVLVLTGNPVVRQIPAYRKTLTLRLKELLNLDNRPVFPRDRACAEAWQRGGVQEEIAERRRWIARDQEKVNASVRYLINMRDKNKAVREAREKEEREKLGLPPKEEEKDGSEESKDKKETKDKVESTEQTETTDVKKEEPETASRTEIEGPSTLEEKFGPEKVEVKEGVPVDMLTGSEFSSSSEGSSSSEDSEDEEGPETSKIEWSQIERGKHLIQEIKDEMPHPAEVPAPADDYWYGYRGNVKPNTSSARNFTDDFQAVNNLLFTQQPHVDSRKRVTKILEESKKSRDKMHITEITDESDKDKERSETPKAERKPLIEMIDEKIPLVEEIISEIPSNEVKSQTGIEEKEGRVIDHDKKLIFDNPKDTDTNQNSNILSEHKSEDKTGTDEIKPEQLDDKKQIITPSQDASVKQKQDKSEFLKPPPKAIKKPQDNRKIQPLKKIQIKEIKLTKVPITEVPLKTENENNNKASEGDSVKEKEKESNKEEAKESNKEDACKQSSSGSQISEVTTRGNVRHEGDGVALINYMQRMNDPNAVYDDEDLDLEPSAEDLEIFAELEREQEERQARIARGEPAVDPMKLYHKKTMEEFYKAEERVPAHEVKEKSLYTTFQHDNAFDRIALSQLTAGDKPDEKKVKLTHVPGAVLFQYVDQKPEELQYEIGDENVDDSLSSGDTDSIDICSDAELSDDESTTILETKKKEDKPKYEVKEKKPEKDKGDSKKAEEKDSKEKSQQAVGTTKRVRPGTACKPKTPQRPERRKSAQVSSTPKKSSDSYVRPGRMPSKGHACKDENEEWGSFASYKEPEAVPRNIPPPAPTTSHDDTMMIGTDRDEAKQSIIDTINSYQDDRFPSQGVNYSDMQENARIEQSVASEILERTLRYEEQELYRQYDVITSHAGKIDNRTNTIIEHMAGQLENQYTLPEVSRILEVHMDEAEQRWRAGEFVHYVPVSPPESDNENDNDNDPTLVPSHDTSLEDTLTEDNANPQQNMEVIRENDDDNNKSGNGSHGDGNNKHEDATIESTDAEDLEEDAVIKGEVKSVDANDADSITTDYTVAMTDISTDVDEFEDCVEQVIDDEKFERVEENYSLEMKLALGIEYKNI
ncbi:uncharacterized protein LOC126376975 [Pectinophora gossypiella]|uniref:uncharacterized protein LOC126376975 n=1 Tax=Pectinophora gossypiella TaxID=13191 RepID=UPI00214E5B91|nr:uncharacterized protein LOC126376975 [Pectinophora gossypiella]